MIKYYFKITPYIFESAYNAEDPLYVSFEDLLVNEEIKNKIKLWTSTIRKYVDKPNSYYNIKSIHWYALKLKEEMQIYLGEEWKIICCSKNKIIQFLIEELSKSANIHRSTGRCLEAIKYFKGALALNPGDYELLNGIAFCYYATDQLDNACHYLKQNIERNSSHAPAFFNLGLCFRKLNDFVVAGIYFEKARNLNPEKVDYTIQYAHNLIDLKLHKKAIEILLAASNKWEGNKEILNKLAYAYLQSEDYLESIKLLQKLLLLHPDDHNFVYRLGICFALINEYEKSTQYFFETLSIDPDYKECYFNIALNYHLQGLDHLSVDMYVRALLRNCEFTENFWGEDNFLLNLNISDEFKITILSFGSENGDEHARIALEGSSLYQQNTN